jgi:DUF4097 and DUF4098 domain-containing protein YvlB
MKASLMLIGTAALLWALAASPRAVEAPQARAPQTDETVPVSRDARLTVDNFAGEVVIHTWERDSLRVQARHSAGTKVVVRPGASSVAIRAESSRGRSGTVDYDITAPAWMPMKIEGQYTNVTVDGAKREVSAETVRGDIRIKGGSGTIIGKTIQGEVVIEGTRGRLDVSSVNQGIRITGASGEITAETTNGSIAMAHVDAASVDVATINGDLTYDGTLADNGRYSFASHNGDIVLTLPARTNATFSVRVYHGEFNSSLPVKGPDPSEARRGRRASYVLGTGSAEVELESFGGAIRLRPPSGGGTGGRP